MPSEDVLDKLRAKICEIYALGADVSQIQIHVSYAFWYDMTESLYRHGAHQPHRHDSDGGIHFCGARIHKADPHYCDPVASEILACSWVG